MLSFWAISVSAAEQTQTQPQALTPPLVIALAPILEPAKYSVENRGSALSLVPFGGYWGQRGIDAGRGAEFTDVMKAQKLDFGAEMTAALTAALTENGVGLVPLDEIKYWKDDPRSLEFAQLKSSSNLVLVTHIDEVGVVSARSTTTYAPRFNVTFSLVDRRTEDSFYDTTIYYGVDARKNTEDQILADPKHVFETYEQAMQHGEDMATMFREGIRKIAALAAPQVRNAKIRP